MDATKKTGVKLRVEFLNGEEGVIAPLATPGNNWKRAKQLLNVHGGNLLTFPVEYKHIAERLVALWNKAEEETDNARPA